MKTIIFLILSVSLIYGQSYHSITIDGTNDFTSNETIATSTAGYTSYVTWDKNYLYLGYSGSDIGSSGSDTKWIVFYFDTDPKLDPVSSSDAGTTTAVGFNTQNWTLPFNADYMLQIRTDKGFNGFKKYIGGNWADSSTSGISFYDNDAANYIEVKIPLSKIGSPKQINLLGYFINETAFSEATYAIFPSGSLSDGYYSSGSFTKYENYYLIGQVFQNISNHVNNFEWLIHLKASTSELADTNIYAGMGVNSTDGFDSGVDIAKPPAPTSNYLDVFFSYPDWTTSLGPRFTRDIKKRISLDSTTSIWDFKISTDQTSQQVTINATDFDFVPANYDIKLYDAVVDSTHNLRTNGSYIYVSSSSAGERNFKLIVGTTLTSPNITPNVTSIDFGSVKTNASKTINLLISNSGDSTLIISNIISTNNSVFTFTGGTSYNITSNNSVTIPVTFSPNAAINYSEQLQILSNDPDTDTLFIALTGTGIALKPHISVSNTTLNFDSVKVDYDSTISFKIYNTGDTVLSVSGISLSNTDFSFVGPTSFDIAVNDSVERSVKFTPTVVSTYTDSLQIFSNDSDNDTLSVRLTGYGSKATFAKSFTPGWHLFSIPVRPVNNLAGAVIGDDISQYFLLSYNRATGYASVDSLSEGVGYWLGIDSATVIDVKGTPIVDSVEINLNAGWNIISSPYVRKYPVNNIYFRTGTNWVKESAAVDSGWIQNSFYYYDENDSSYSATDSLYQWRGNWMMALTENLSALYLHEQTAGTPLTPHADESIKNSKNNWLVTINAENELGRKDNLLKFGVNENATDGFDVKYDLAKPPVSPGYGNVQTYFLHSKWTPYSSKFSRDVKAPFSEHHNSGWSFTVKSAVSGNITLRWENILEEYPVDSLSNLGLSLSSPIIPSGSIDMLNKHSFSFSAQANIAYIFGINSVLVDVNETNMPLKFDLEQNYPNPFNPSTVIEYTIPSISNEQNLRVKLSVFDVLGKEVTVLVNKHERPGKYKVKFDANNLSSGIYFYKLTAGKFVGIKKMVLLK